jgi:hypothetical protein
MDQSLATIYEHMKDFGLYLLAKGVVDATFSAFENPYSSAVSVPICSQAAEILIKARIAQEHPLLIFSKLPRLSTTDDRNMELQDLFEHGRTLMYSELPDLLWAATGYRMSNLERYNSYGSLRNCIVHFSVPERDLSEETYRFAFEVMQPMLNDFWQENILEYIPDFDQPVEYVEEALDRLNITYQQPSA